MLTSSRKRSAFIVFFFQFQHCFLYHLGGKDAAVRAGGEHEHPLGSADEAWGWGLICKPCFLALAHELAYGCAQRDPLAFGTEHGQLIGIVVECDGGSHEEIMPQNRDSMQITQMMY
jgi:hypothetical protein